VFEGILLQSERRWRSLATCHRDRELREEKRREEEARREVKRREDISTEYICT